MEVCTPFEGIQKIEGIYPRGLQKVYHVVFSDGREIDCDLDHLWELRTTKQVHKYRAHQEHKNFMVWNTSRVIKELDSGKKLFMQIPNAQEFSEKEYVIPPYVIGVLLGDGCITESCIRVGRHIDFSTSEQDIVEKMARLTESTKVSEQKTGYTKSLFTPHYAEYKAYLREKGLNTYSYNKYIPEEYLFGSIEQRRQLLAGLFDTDGCIEEKNRFSYSTTSKRLKDDFCHLCRSLGYIVRVKEDRRQKYTNGNVAYDISICTFDRIFTSKKHTERYEANEQKYEYQYHRTEDHVRLKSVTYVGMKKTQCIRVSGNDHLYIGENFITTHNTAGAMLANAEPGLDPNYRAVFFRRTLGELKAAGGVVDEFQKLYGNAVSITRSENPRITFQSGAWIECRQIADENPDKVRETFKGLQADCLFFEELTGFSFYTWNYLTSRARGTCSWTGKVRATTNPSKRHWVRKMIDWYINDEGFVPKERSGVVRYFYLDGRSVDDYVWGDSKEEVYLACKDSIDRKLRMLNDPTLTYENLIKSFTFILGNIAENKALLDNNKDYVGNVSGTEGDALLMGNWNVDLDEDAETVISPSSARSIVSNDQQTNGIRYMTIDLADVGTDNTVILVWDGYHIIDVKLITEALPEKNVRWIKSVANKYSVPDSHIIYDSRRSPYMLERMPNAVAFDSCWAPRGLYRREFMSVKDECYMRLVYSVNSGKFSIDPEVASRNYVHQNIKNPISFLEEFVEECKVVQYNDLPSGKKRLYSKKEMNRNLGMSRSMDICDPCAMRFFPDLMCEYGSELVTSKQENDEEDEENEFDIYDEGNWS